MRPVEQLIQENYKLTSLNMGRNFEVSGSITNLNFERTQHPDTFRTVVKVNQMCKLIAGVLTSAAVAVCVGVIMYSVFTSNHRANSMQNATTRNSTSTPPQPTAGPPTTEQETTHRPTKLPTKTTNHHEIIEPVKMVTPSEDLYQCSSNGYLDRPDLPENFKPVLDILCKPPGPEHHNTSCYEKHEINPGSVCPDFVTMKANMGLNNGGGEEAAPYIEVTTLSMYSNKRAMCVHNGCDQGFCFFLSGLSTDQERAVLELGGQQAIMELHHDSYWKHYWSNSNCVVPRTNCNLTDQTVILFPRFNNKNQSQCTTCADSAGLDNKFYLTCDGLLRNLPLVGLPSLSPQAHKAAHTQASGTTAAPTPETRLPTPAPRGFKPLSRKKRALCGVNPNREPKPTMPYWCPMLQLFPRRSNS
uniref:Glycoprotein n=1 Tax=Pneumovirus HFR-2013 TaxID=1346740 RepID=R9XYY5_9MONO|nr:glycoprotein [Pneumovirus HFR-2013]